MKHRTLIILLVSLVLCLSSCAQPAENDSIDVSEKVTENTTQAAKEHTAEATTTTSEASVTEITTVATTTEAVTTTATTTTEATATTEASTLESTTEAVAADTENLDELIPEVPVGGQYPYIKYGGKYYRTDDTRRGGLLYYKDLAEREIEITLKESLTEFEKAEYLGNELLQVTLAELPNAPDMSISLKNSSAYYYGENDRYELYLTEKGMLFATMIKQNQVTDGEQIYRLYVYLWEETTLR